MPGTAKSNNSDYQQILHHFHQIADPTIAQHSQRFFKTQEGQYGYGDIFLGIRVPLLRQTIQKYKNVSLDVAEQLLQSKYHEVRLFALFLLVFRFSKPKLNEQDSIYALYMRNLPYVNNWDLVDSSAYHILGPYIEQRDRSVLDQLALSDSLWERRIAIISTFHFIRQHDFEDTLRLAALLLHDKEDLIHKAVGWMLREVGKRDINFEIKFLQKHASGMPRTMLRYAIEKLDKEQRLTFLKMK